MNSVMNTGLPDGNSCIDIYKEKLIVPFLVYSLVYC